MNVEVNINPEDVQAQVAQAILDSAFGKTIATEVERAVKSARGWDSRNAVSNSIQEALRREVVGIAREELQKHSTVIRDQIREQLTPEVLTTLANEAVQKISVGGMRIMKPGEED